VPALIRLCLGVVAAGSRRLMACWATASKLKQVAAELSYKVNLFLGLNPVPKLSLYKKLVITSFI
jgi:hypothetical protein